MNVDYINSFVEASQLVLKSIANLDISIGKVNLKKLSYSNNILVIMIGLIGELNGQVLFSMNETIACKIASAMMGGMPVAKLDEISKSAISEAVNMILGNTSSILFNRGKQINITPPSAAMGSDILISLTDIKNICVPLNIVSGGTIELNIALAE